MLLKRGVDMIEYDFEMDRIFRRIEENKAKLVGIQLPDGLKKRALDIASQIEEKTDAKVVIFADPCYGACDTKDAEAKRLGLDLIVHFGHTEWV
jgi:2-(3-amino-3-carboxypropyl)histidine synthase